MGEWTCRVVSVSEGKLERSGNERVPAFLYRLALGDASPQRPGLFGSRLPKRPITRRGEAADQPVGLHRICNPGLCPPVGNARFDGFLRDFASVPVEYRQLAAGLGEAAREVANLRFARPQFV